MQGEPEQLAILEAVQRIADLASAIHVRQAGRLIGFMWPARIYAPEVVASAQREFDALRERRRVNSRIADANGPGDTNLDPS